MHHMPIFYSLFVVFLDTLSNVSRVSYSKGTVSAYAHGVPIAATRVSSRPEKSESVE